MYRGMICLALSAALLPDLVLANPPPPPDFGKEKKAKVNENVALTIIYAKDVKNERATLKIPKKYMVALGDAELAPVAEGPSHRMLYAGMAISAAMVTGGLWFIRRSSKGARGILALFILSGVLTCAAFLPRVDGNAGIRLPQIEIDGSKVKMKMDVVVTGDGDRVELVLPSSLAPAAVKR